MAFLAMYGWTMWTVQRFEYYLAALSILRSPVKKPERLIDTPQKAYSALQKQFAVYSHRFARASAKELQNLLPDGLSDSLRPELDELVEARNELAHRYLQRTLEGTNPLTCVRSYKPSRSSANDLLPPGRICSTL